MVKFHGVTGFEETLYELGLEYQYLYIDRGLKIHRNRFCLLDGTIVIEVIIQEETGNVTIRDSRGTLEYPSLDLEQLNLLIINIGDTLTPVIPYIYIRILYGRRVLHHSEYKK
ncbi:MAG: hypothetical protein VB088_02080 [Sphaerochaeta sp.]|nr:hypothetical protein [Sphaerochaeta sp.]